MNDRQILQWAFDALSQGYEGGRLHDVLAVLHDRLAEPEPVIQARKEGDLIVVDLPQVPRGNGGIYKDAPPKREWINLSAADIKLMRRASTNDRQFAEMIQAKLRDKNS